MKRPLTLIGLFIMAGLSLLLAVTFFQAVAEGGQVTVYVNRLNEMWVEIVLIPAVVLLGLWATYRAVKRELK